MIGHSTLKLSVPSAVLPNDEKEGKRRKAGEGKPGQGRGRNERRKEASSRFTECAASAAAPGNLLELKTGGSPWWLGSEESTCNAGDAGDAGSIPGSGRSPGVGNGNSLQYS